MVRDRYSSSSSSTAAVAYSNRRIGSGGRGGGGGGGGEFMMMVNNINTSSSSSGASNIKPAWLQGLMGEAFFGNCGVHENRRKNEKNVFCLLCCLSICPHCLPSHPSHPLLQVRRYVYHDVIRLGELEKLIDCSFIQPYTINSAKVIFLKQRAQSRSCKGSANICLTCDRILQHPFHFCSLSCKVDHMVDQGEDLSAILCKIHESDFAFSQFEGLRMDSSEILDDHDTQITHNSILEDPILQFRAPSYSNDTMDTSGISQEQPEMIINTKKKKKGSGFLPGIDFSFGSRRKGAPHRAPLS